MWTWLARLGFLGALLTAAPAFAQEPPTPATVVHVVDGDTADVQFDDGSIVRLRLIGMDTPETVDPRQGVQCYGVEASARAHELLDGQIVTLESDPTQDAIDRYGRVLAYVWLPDGTNFAERMIGEGYAFEYTYRAPYAYQEAFRAAEASAREQGAGLWAAETCAGVHGPADLDDIPLPPEPVEPAAVPAPAAPPAPPAATSRPAATPTPVPAPASTGLRYNPAGPDRDCGDFRTHAEAQAFFAAARQATGSRDYHRLDSDADGIACETLP